LEAQEIVAPAERFGALSGSIDGRTPALASGGQRSRAQAAFVQLCK